MKLAVFQLVLSVIWTIVACVWWLKGDAAAGNAAFAVSVLFGLMSERERA